MLSLDFLGLESGYIVIRDGAAQCGAFSEPVRGDNGETRILVTIDRGIEKNKVRYGSIYDALLIREAGHKLFGSFDAWSLKSKIEYFWKREYFRLYRDLCELFEDIRVERLWLERYPSLLPYFAAVAATCNPTDLFGSVYRFMRFGQREDLPDWLYDYLWWRVVVVRRAHSSEVSYRMASEVTGVLRDLVLSEPKYRYAEYRTIKGGKGRKQVRASVNVFGAYSCSGSWEKFAKAIAKSSLVDVFNVGVSTDSIGQFLYGDRYLMIRDYLVGREDEARRLVDLFRSCANKFRVTKAFEGDLNARQMQKAYVNSFQDLESKVFLKRKKEMLEADVLVVMDVSGSMQAFINKVWSDAVVFYWALTLAGFRTAFVCLASNAVVSKDFNQGFVDVLRARDCGYSTNFDSFFSRWIDKLAWKFDQVVVCFTDGLWPGVRVVPNQKVFAFLYHGVNRSSTRPVSSSGWVQRVLYSVNRSSASSSINLPSWVQKVESDSGLEVLARCIIAHVTR